MTCALEATYAYDVRLVCVSNLLRTYSMTFSRKRLMRSKQLMRTKYDCCAWATYCVRDSTALHVNQLMRSKRLMRTKYGFARKANSSSGSDRTFVQSHNLRLHRVSLAEFHQDIKSLEWSQTAQVTSTRSPSLKPTHHSNDLRSHKRDSRNLKKKSQRAKVVLSRTQ